MVEKAQKLGEILLQYQLIQKNDLLQALQSQRSDQRKLGEILISNGLVEEKDIAKALADIYHIRFVNLAEEEITDEVLGVLSNDILQTYHVFPVAVKDDTLIIATSDPLNVSVLQDIQYKSGMTVEPVMASQTQINQFLEEYADSLHTVNAMKSDLQGDQKGDYVVELVESVLRSAIREKATDIHFEPMKGSLRVRYRIDGTLYEKSPINVDAHRNVIARLKIMAAMDVTENRKPQDGRFTFEHANKEYDIRLSSLVNTHGEDMVLRILTKDFQKQSFEGLGMEAKDAAVIHELIHKPFGLILVTGPTGAGKTTTLYSMLNTVNDTTKNIISVEDPVEYEVEGINQTMTNKFTGYTFATSMRYILRHDPDIIMLGEIRDVETAEAAIRAALTGHLVLSTVHTNTAAGAITRLLEMGIEPFLISSALKGVVAQRLVRKLCPACKEEYRPNETIAQKVNACLSGERVETLAQAKGCEACFQTGFAGRQAVYEVLSVGEEMRELVLQKRSEREMNQAAIARGMRTLRVNGMKKAYEMSTTVEEIVSIIEKE